MKRVKGKADYFTQGNEGRNNLNFGQSVARLEKGKSYSDLSTVCVIPTRGVIPAKVCTAIWNLMSPMNNRFYKFCIEGKEVGQAYNEAVEMILANPELSTWKYLLTIEEDNLPPPDGLLKLYENMDKFDAIGGLYWTKGEGTGQPMLYGDPKEMPKNFRPQIPIPNTIQPCNGLGMGFTIFKISMFRELKKKGITTFFKTVQEYQPNVGVRIGTQDLFFFEQAGKHGYSFACDTRVLVGHYDLGSDTVY